MTTAALRDAAGPGERQAVDDGTFSRLVATSRRATVRLKAFSPARSRSGPLLLVQRRADRCGGFEEDGVHEALR
jgi:hypothetical protein